MRTNFFELILNSLPERMAAIDQTGKFVWQNEAWKIFASTGGDGRFFKGGVKNIFEIFEKLDSEGVEGNRLRQELISFLNGASDYFLMDYPSGKNVESAKFRIQVNKVNDPKAAALVRLDDVTEFIAGNQNQKNGLDFSNKPDISTHAKIEQAFQDSQRKLLTMIDNVPGAIYRCINDEFWTMEFISEGCRELTGYEVSDLQFNRTIDYASIIHPDDRQSVWDNIQSSVRDQQPFELTYRIRTARGEEKWVWERGRGVFSAEGDLIALEGFIADVTFQRKAQEELKKQESVLRSIFSAAPSGMGIIKKRINLQVNERLAQMLGYTVDEMLGKETRIFYGSDEEFERVGRELYSDQHKSEARVIEARLSTKRGDSLDVLISSAMLDPENPDAGNVFIITDISEQKKAQERLINSEERYRMLFDKMLNGFALHEVITDEEGKPVDYRFLEVNSAYEKFTGLKAENLLNKTVRDILPEVEGFWIERYGKVALTGESTHFEEYTKSLDKTYEVYAYCPKIDQFAVLVVDITDRKKAEQKMLELSRNLSDLVKELRCLYGTSIIIEDETKSMPEKIEQIIKIIPPAFQHPQKIAVRLSIENEVFTSQNFQETDKFLAHEIKLRGETVGRIEIFSLDRDPKSDDLGFTQEEISLVIEMCGRLGEMIAHQRSENASKESEARWQGIFTNSIDGILLFDDEGKIKESNQAACQTLGYSREELLTLSLPDILISEDHARFSQGWSRFYALRKATAEYQFKHKNGKTIPMEARASAYVLPGLHLATLRNLTEKRRHKQEQETALSIASALRMAQTKSETIKVLLESLKNKLNLDSIGLAFQNREKDEFKYDLVLGLAADLTGKNVPVSEGVASALRKTLQPYIKNDILDGTDTIQTYQYLYTKTLVIIPLIAQNDLMGLIVAGKGNRFEDGDVRILMSAVDMGANAILRADLYEMTRRRLEQIEALHQIDLAINANTDLNSALDVFLDQTLLHMKVDAADILIYEESTQSLVFATGKGFYRKPISQYSSRLGNGCAGKVALTRRMRWSGDLLIDADARTECNLRWANEGFLSYCGVPLIAKGKVKGVLELFNRSSLQPDEEWFRFLDTMAGQAAIAIDNATLFNRLEQSHLELMLAFDTTIVGWARSLELHELESEGHTHRTVTLAQMLAQEAGLNEDELIQFRRGALLHDIGKIAVPHEILNKPGKLTDAEWKIIRQHPQKAFEILSEIPFLQQALDVPYYHHEKWDGTGYPHGLAGEQIPIGARVFALVDVFDALTSDRPYRKAWSQTDAINYLREQAGKHFDPMLVEPFIQLVFQTTL